MRRERPPKEPAQRIASLADWHQQLIDRRQFLLRLAGGSLAALFGPPLRASDQPPGEAEIWQVLDVVQRHLLPSEADAPGAAEINALGYLRFVIADPKVDAGERAFILQGVSWLEGIAREMTARSFIDLDDDGRERVLRKVASSRVGENWMSTLILYLMEALLTDPVYGGNINGIGWRWLEHVPGYPRPPKEKTYPRLFS